MPTTQLTPHFTLEEFTRSDTATARGIVNSVDDPTHLANLKTLAAMMERVRTALGNRPIYISSGYRNPELNRAVGGVPNSQHAIGQACDFSCPQFGTPYAIAVKLAGERDTIKFDQLIYEHLNGARWVHISWSDTPRLQELTATGNGYHGGIVNA